MIKLPLQIIGIVALALTIKQTLSHEKRCNLISSITHLDYYFQSGSVFCNTFGKGYCDKEVTEGNQLEYRLKLEDIVLFQSTVGEFKLIIDVTIVTNFKKLATETACLKGF